MTQSAPFLVGAAIGMILYFLLFPKSVIFFIRYESSSIPEENVVQELLDEFYRGHKLDVRRLENQMDFITDDEKDLKGKGSLLNKVTYTHTNAFIAMCLFRHEKTTMKTSVSDGCFYSLYYGIRIPNAI